MRALLVLALLAGTAHADDRATALSVGFILGVHTLPDVMGEPGVAEPAIEQFAEGFGGPRATLTFEREMVPYPDHRGYNTDVQLVPELLAGAFKESTHAEGMIGAGLRGELRIAQREGGLMRINARVSLYLAARAMVIGDTHDPMLEYVIGEHLWFGKSGRIGVEVGGSNRRVADASDMQNGLVMQLLVGGAL